MVQGPHGKITKAEAQDLAAPLQLRKQKIFQDPSFRMAVTASGNISLNQADSRCSSLRFLHAIASKEALVRSAMWFDVVNVKKNVLVAANDECGLVREIRSWALATMLKLALDFNVKADMWQDANARQAVLRAVAESDDVQVRSLGFALLQSLAVNGDNAKSMWGQRDLRQLLLNREADRSCLEALLGTLQNISYKTAGTGGMWDAEDGASVLLTEAALLTDAADRRIRAAAISTMHNLSANEVNSRKMWMDDASVRPAVVKCAMLHDKLDRKIRIFALATLQDWAKLPANREEMWHHEGARKAIVIAALLVEEVDNQARWSALAALQSLSACKAVSQSILADLAHTALLMPLAKPTDETETKGLSEAEPDQKRRPRPKSEEIVVPKAKTVRSASPPRNSVPSAVLQLVTLGFEPQVAKEALAAANGKVKAAAAALAAAAKAGRSYKGPDGNIRPQRLFGDALRRVILRAARSDIPQERVCCLGILQNLCSMAAKHGNGLDIWNDPPLAPSPGTLPSTETLRSALLGFANSGPVEARVVALGALRNLCEDAQLRKIIWYDELAHAIIVEAALSQREEWYQIREVAASIIGSFTFDETLRAKVWVDPQGCLGAIIRNAGCEDPEERPLKALAFAALEEMTWITQIASTIWRGEMLRNLVLEAASSQKPEERDFRINALGILQNMTCSLDNLVDMWANEQVQRVIRLALTPKKKFSCQTSGGDAVKTIGLGMLYNFSFAKDASICVPFTLHAANSLWKDKAIREPIVDAARSTDPKDDDAKQRATALMQKVVFGEQIQGLEMLEETWRVPSKI
jgi:hypothetical protein